jgi:hypothetical protein
MSSSFFLGHPGLTEERFYRAYAGKPCYMDTVKPHGPYTPLSELAKEMRICQENQRMGKQMTEINEAVVCLRYLFGEKIDDKRPFMKELANEILNKKTTQVGINTRIILGVDLAERMALELLELAESKDPIVYAPIERLYRKYHLLKDEQIRKMDWSHTRITT